MAVVLGTSSGFVRTAPTADPAGTNTTIDGSSVVTKDTAPAGARTITEIGWYRGAGTNGANFEVALYSDSAGVATTRLNVDNTNSSTSGGWITTAVSWSITPGTAYWLAVQMDAHSGSSSIDSEASGGAGSDVLTSQTTLNDPYGGGAVADADGMYAIYALVTGTEVSVTPSTGEVTIAGFVPTVTATANQNVTAGVGAVTLEGFVPVWSTASAGSSFSGTPANGEVTLTGFAPTASVTENTTVTADVGSVTLTGFAPTASVTANVEVVADVGSVALDGFAPAVFATDSQVFTPDVGSLTLTGFAPTVAATTNGPGSVTADYGYLLFTGHRPTVTTARVARGNAVGASLLLVWNIRHGLGVYAPERKPKQDTRKRLPRLRYEGVDAGQLVKTETGVPLAGVPPAVAFLAMEWMDG